MPARKAAKSASRSRKGPRYFHGDDLTKTAADRKRTSSTEPWERKPAKKSAGSARASAR